MKKDTTDLFEELKRQRMKIDAVDKKLLSLLNRRLRLALQAGKIKKEMGAKIYNPKREDQVLERLMSKNKGPLREEDLKKIFATVMKICRKSQE